MLTWQHLCSHCKLSIDIYFFTGSFTISPQFLCSFHFLSVLILFCSCTTIILQQGEPLPCTNRTGEGQMPTGEQVSGQTTRYIGNLPIMRPLYPTVISVIISTTQLFYCFKKTQGNIIFIKCLASGTRISCQKYF